MNRALQLPLAVALLGATPPETPGVAGPAGERVVPVPTPAARVLSALPTGARSLLGLTLWLTESAWSAPGLPPFRREELALALLASAPDLERVRREVAEWFVTQRAPRERDEARHRALVVRGLSLLEEGLRRAPSAALHASFGELLAPRSREQLADPRRQRVAEQLFGERGEELAIASFRHALERSSVRARLIDLLLDRGELALDRGDDAPAALRDLAEVEALLQPGADGGPSGRSDQVERLHELRARTRHGDASRPTPEPARS